MKRIAAIMTSLMFISSLTACSNAEQQNNSSEPIPESSEIKATEQETNYESENESTKPAFNTKTENNSGKTLVVYYSASGNTEAVAGYIAEAVNGDIFEIEPVDIYTNADLNWTDQDSRVCYEYNNPDARDIELVSTEVSDWDSYDTVFIGYPIWWGIAAWPVDNFVKENDFTGKTVIPFCTSSSSGLGESGALLAEMAGTGDWQDGERFRSSVSEEDVKVWVEGLGL